MQAVHKKEVSSELLSQPSQTMNAIVYGFRVTGWGDLVAADKIAGLIEKMNLFAKFFLVTNAMREMQFLDSEHRYEILSDKDIAKVHHIALQIVASASTIADFAHILSSSYPTLIFYEYGFENHPVSYVDPKWINSYSLGLNQSQKNAGIFIDQELFDWGFSEAATDPVQRLGKLQQASSFIQEAIFGQKFDTIEDLSEKAKSMKLYYTYAKTQGQYAAFFQAIVRLDTDTQDIVFVFSNGRIFSNEPDITNLIKDLPIKEIIVKKMHAEGKIEELHRKANALEGKTVTICIGQINHRDAKVMIMSSEPETLSVGDHSVSENISANKCADFIYPDFKREFAESYQNFLRQPISIAENQTNFYTKHLMQFFSWCRNKENREKLSAIHKAICEQFNFSTIFPKLVYEYLESQPSSAPIDFRAYTEPLTREDFPIDKAVFVTTAQRDRQLLNLFQDDEYESAYVSYGHWIVKRVR